MEGGFTVKLIELIPPKPNRDYGAGLEHAGIVIGKRLNAYAKRYEDKLTVRQNQSPICKPYFIKLNNKKYVKFNDISLKGVIESERKGKSLKNSKNLK